MAYDLWKQQTQQQRRREGDPSFACPLTEDVQACLGISPDDVRTFCAGGCFDRRCIGGRRDCKAAFVRQYGRKYRLTIALDGTGNRTIVQKPDDTPNTSLSSRRCMQDNHGR